MTPYAWGWNGHGELGNGTTTTSDVPVQVSGLSGVTAVAGGGFHSLALRSDGTVWAWGHNHSGQLGNGTTTTTGCDCIAAPVQVSGLSGVTAVAGGESHSLALRSDGTVWTWGYNYNGELGNGTTTTTGCYCIAVPVQVSGLSGVTAVAGGGHSLALRNDGTVWAWGSNGAGQLGNGTTTSSAVPVQVSGLSGVTAVAGGRTHSLALRSDGTVWAWGSNYSGQLGNGTTTDSAVPVPVGGRGVTAVAAGLDHSLALRSDGTVWAWGYNAAGQLGNGTTTDSVVPVWSGLSGVTAVAGGGYHSLALRSDGTVWAWGDNIAVPVQVSGLSGVTAVAGGVYHSLALAPGGQGFPVGGAPSPQENPADCNPSDPHLCAAQCSAGKPCNLESGTFWHSFTDLTVAGRGSPLQLTRTYSTVGAATTGPFGYGWTLSYNMSLTTDAQNNATISQENGSQVTFLNSGGTYAPAAPRTIATLVHNGDGSWTFQREARQSFTFSASGQLTQEQDLNGYTTTLGYTAGQLTSITDPAGRALTLTWSGGHIASVVDPVGRSVTYGYNDGAGNLTDVTDVAGGNEHFTYDTAHRMLTMRDPRSNTVTNTFDASGRISTQADELGRTTTFAYGGDNASAAGGTTTVTDPKGNVTREQYSYALLRARTMGFGTSQAAVWTYAYDPATLGQTRVTDPNGHTTSMTYDSQGNLLTTTDALGRTTTNTYDALNDITSTMDPLGVVTTATYDARGNLTSTSTPLVGVSPAQTRTVTFLYGDGSHPGDVTGTTDPDGKTSTTVYDANGDPVSATDPLGERSTTAYNGIGWRLSSTTPAGHTTQYEYNNFDDLTSSTDALSHVSSFTYDPNRNKTNVTDADGHHVVTTYDAANQPTSVTRADGTTVQTGYDADGNVTAQTDGAGRVTNYAYDALNRVSSVSDPLGRTTTYGYDMAGNRTSLSDPSSQTTTYSYDAASQLTSTSYSDGTTPNVSNITYDADGQMLTMTDGTGNSSWSYDSLHRLTRSLDGAGATSGYGYDLNGQVTSLIYPGAGNLTVKRAYDAAGRLTQVTDWLGNTTSFAYNPDSNLTTESFPGAAALRDSYRYDGADRLVGISDLKGRTTLASFTYTRDANGQLSSANTTGITQAPQTYTYTPLNQLKNVNSASYGYSAADNLTTLTSGASLSYDVANELTSMTQAASTTQFAYDQRGNRISTTPAPGTPVTYGYDQANRLTTYGSTAHYTYNGAGLRMSKTVASASESFAWDLSGSLPLLLKDAATSYVYGPGGLPLEQVGPTGAVLYYHHDQLGSTRLLTDGSGSVAASYGYNSYGAVTSSTGAALNPFGFAGQFTDSESGFIYLRARYYDPSNAQFLSRDPLASVTRAPYAYVGDNPTNATDPSGMSSAPASGWCGGIFPGAGPCDPRCSPDFQPLGPWQCWAAAGAVKVNDTYVAPVAEKAASVLDHIATVCSAGAFTVVGAVCATEAGYLGQWAHLSVALAHPCDSQAQTDAIKSVVTAIPGLAASQVSEGVGHVIDFGFGVLTW